MCYLVIIREVTSKNKKHYKSKTNKNKQKTEYKGNIPPEQRDKIQKDLQNKVNELIKSSSKVDVFLEVEPEHLQEVCGCQIPTNGDHDSKGLFIYLLLFFKY